LLASISILRGKNKTFIFYLVALYRRQAKRPVFFNLNFKGSLNMAKFKIKSLDDLISKLNIVVIATYSKRNTKTGEVVQTYILVDGMNPLDASKTGADFSICGDCAMRGEVTTDPTRKQAKNRRCYVNLGQGVLIVYKSFLRGVYAIADNISARKSIGRKRFVRVGTYGDPAAVPPAVWEELLSEADTFTAYSHQSGWRPDIAMQSADNYAQAFEHWKAGRRTFRVVSDILELDKKNEVLCPASKEAGRRVQCTACKLCKGSALAKSIAIVEH
jgi:hypothetical protein